MKTPNWAHEFYDFQYTMLISFDKFLKNRVDIINKFKVSFINQRILDIGCGRGEFLVMAAAHNKVVGIDISKSACIISNQNIKENNVDAEIVNMDILDYNTENKFNLITYWDGFGISDDLYQEIILRKIYSLLDNEGSFILELYNPFYWANMDNKKFEFNEVSGRKYNFDFINSRMIDTWWNGNIEKNQNLRCYSFVEIKQLLNCVGFKIVYANFQLKFDQTINDISEIDFFSKNYSYILLLKKNV